MAFFRIRFITETDLISDAIRAVTSSLWSHVEILTPKGTWIGAHAIGGVRERAANYFTPSRVRRYAIPVTDDQLTKMMAFAYAKLGAAYDFKDIAGLFLHQDLHTPGREICSMFTLEAAMAGGLQMLNVQPGFTNLVTPEMLHLSPLLIGRCEYQFP